MASDFATKFAGQGIPKLLNRLGDATTYAPVSGSPAPFARTLVFDVLDESQEFRRGVFLGALADYGSEVPGDKIADAEGLAWEVVEVRPNNCGDVELLCHTPKLNT